MDAIQSQMFDVMTARRLLIKARQLDLKKCNPDQKTTSAKEDMEEDQAFLSGAGYCCEPDSKTCKRPIENLDIKLNDLNKLRHQDPRLDRERIGMDVEIETAIEVSAEEVKATVVSLERIDGLVWQNQRKVETDRYRFDFMDGSTLKITDKWASRSTTIWGDPHIDSSDIDGNWDGDFKDLQQSNTHTTFMLQDGTRLTITARDDGIIEAVDIYYSSTHITGTGAGKATFNEKTGYFQKPITSENNSAIPLGDVVYAGGDGNDWYDSARKLIWGKTTGPQVIGRPASVLVLEYTRVDVAINEMIKASI